MKVLLIDNKSAHLEKLRELIIDKLGEVNFCLRDPREMLVGDVENADLIVFSGGVGRSIEKNPMTFKRMVELAVGYGKPAIGICLGAEAIAAFYGASLVEMPVRRVGNVRQYPTAEFAAELGIDEKGFMAYEFHKWRIDNLVEPLVPLVTSKDGIEVFRHRNLPLWGMQFHPEVRRLDNQGHEIFEFIITACNLLVVDRAPQAESSE